MHRAIGVSGPRRGERHRGRSRQWQAESAGDSEAPPRRGKTGGRACRRARKARSIMAMTPAEIVHRALGICTGMDLARTALAIIKTLEADGYRLVDRAALKAMLARARARAPPARKRRAK